MMITLLSFLLAVLISPFRSSNSLSIRRECLGHVIVLGEAHRRRILRAYADYYNGVRTHRSLNKDAPISRPIQRGGLVAARPIGWIASSLRSDLDFRTHRS